jgi:L-iditol 2-dehydrogenase
MTKKMLAAFIRAPFEVQLRQVAIPKVRDGWALVKVRACGICGTDLHLARSQAKDWQTWGHEVAGEVAQAGRGVAAVREGDWVALESSSFCGRCDQCRNGRVDLCSRAPRFGQAGVMGFAEYVLAPHESLAPFTGLDFAVACLAEPLGVAMDMVRTAGIGLGDETLVLGLGPIGLMSIPLALRQGAGRLYAANRSGGRRVELARRFGADEVFLTGEQPLDGRLFRTGGVDRALVSASPRLLPATLALMNPGGVVAFIGIEHGPGGVISFDANDFHFNKLQLRASHASPALYLPLCLQLLKDGQVDGPALISHTLPLERLAEGLQLLRDQREQTLKVVITP